MTVIQGNPSTHQPVNSVYSSASEAERESCSEPIERRIRRTQFPNTDSGNAERLISKFGYDFLYLHDRGKWLRWDGKRWSIDETAEIHRAAKATVRDMYPAIALIEDDTTRHNFSKWVVRSESRNGRESMVTLAQKESRVAALSRDFDTDPMLLNVQNGTLDFHTGRLREHQRADRITKLCPMAFDPEAKCDRWLAFLDETFPDQPEIVAFLQRSLGYSLTADTEQQCFWLLIGSGKNGKSRFLDAIQFILGDYAVATSFDTFAAKKGGAPISPRDGMASLVGSRFVRASESDEGIRFSEAQLKALTGGERIRTARMYQQDFDFKPTFKIWLSTNHEPTIRGTDDGIWRRIHRVNFDQVVPEARRDLHLGEKLQSEAPGILNWALEGLKQYQVRGLQVPQSVVKATVGYRENQNLVARFFKDRTEKADRFEIDATALYGTYKTWASDNSERALSQTFFGKEARKLVEHKRGNTGRNVYVGIRIRSEEDHAC
jgi:putative DNA primase/helicase